jgi:DNA-binding transcriptional regulator YdaS (Cro superfamily)
MSHNPGMDVKEIIRLAGGASKLARILGLHHTSVLGWKIVPPKHVPALAALLEVGRHEIRPDLWEAPSDARRVA